MDRRALKEAYKQKEIPKGVYQIRNIRTGQILVGASPNLDGAFNSQWFQLKHGSHLNRELQKDWNQYGEEAFVFEILDELEPRVGATPNEDRADLKALEEMWVEKLQPFGAKGYNWMPRKD